VSVQLRNQGPLAEARQAVMVAASPSVTLGPDRTLCAGSAATLTPSQQPTGTTYRWQDGTTTATYPVSRSGVYWLDVTSAQGCTTRDSVRVNLLEGPVASLGPAEQPICVNQTLTLTPGPQPASTTYRWQDGSTATTYTATGPGTYRLTLSTPNGCTSSAEIVLSIGDQCPVSLPNIITPNADYANDVFVLRGLPPGPWSLEVYNRWGRQEFATSNYQDDWGAGAASGIYYYLLRRNGTSTIYKGWVEVVR